MVVTYAIYASIAAAGLVLGLVMGLVLAWLWHRGEIVRLRALLQSSEDRRHKLRAQAEARLEELRARLRESGR